MYRLLYRREENLLTYEQNGQEIFDNLLRPLTRPLTSQPEEILTVTPEQRWPDEVYFLATQQGHIIVSAPEDQIHILHSSGDLDSPITAISRLIIPSRQLVPRRFDPQLARELTSGIGRRLSEIGRPAPAEVFNSISLGLDEQNETSYYIVNDRYYYYATVLTLLEETPLTNRILDLPEFKTHPVQIVGDGLWVVDSTNLDSLPRTMIPRDITPLLAPDLSQIRPGAARLVPADLPEFNRDLYQQIEDLIRRDEPMSNLFPKAQQTSFIDEEFLQSYTVFVSKFYGIPVTLPPQLLYRGEWIPVVSQLPPGTQEQLGAPVSLQPWADWPKRLLLVRVNSQNYLLHS